MDNGLKKLVAMVLSTIVMFETSILVSFIVMLNPAQNIVLAGILTGLLSFLIASTIGNYS